MTQGADPIAQDESFQSCLQKLSGLIGEVDGIADPEARATTRRIIESLMEFHGAALSALCAQLVEKSPDGQAIISRLATDELIASLFLVYDLHPDSLEQRVAASLQKVRPYLASHGGNVELLSISDEGVVNLAMQGSCHGCPSSALTLKNSIEESIYSLAPDVSAIHVQGMEDAAEAPLELVAKDLPRNGFVSVDSLIASSARHQVAQGAST